MSPVAHRKNRLTQNCIKVRMVISALSDSMVVTSWIHGAYLWLAYRLSVICQSIAGDRQSPVWL